MLNIQLLAFFSSFLPPQNEESIKGTDPASTDNNGILPFKMAAFYFVDFFFGLPQKYFLFYRIRLYRTVEGM